MTPPSRRQRKTVKTVKTNKDHIRTILSKGSSKVREGVIEDIVESLIDVLPDALEDGLDMEPLQAGEATNIVIAELLKPYVEVSKDQLQFKFEGTS